MSDEYSKQKREELKKYIAQIENPSVDFNRFLNDYFIEHPMWRARGEEDITVWDRLKGEELAVAKQMVLDNLDSSEHSSACIQAIGIFKDERGVPLLERLIDTLDDSFADTKLEAAKILYDWIGYEPYPELLKRLLQKSTMFTKTNISYYVGGIDENLAIYYIFLMLRDEDPFVRWCAYGELKEYLRPGTRMSRSSIKEQKKAYAENKYYTGDSVYADKELFENRLMALRGKVTNFLEKAEPGAALPPFCSWQELAEVRAS